MWDVENSNPNGDILSGNEPRRDNRTGIAEVTDVRIKRTIRDEIIKSKPESIFVKEYRDCNNNVLQAKEVVEFFKINMEQPVDQVKADENGNWKAEDIDFKGKAYFDQGYEIKASSVDEAGNVADLSTPTTFYFPVPTPPEDHL